jgi:ribosomal protein S9
LKADCEKLKIHFEVPRLILKNNKNHIKEYQIILQNRKKIECKKFSFQKKARKREKGTKNRWDK